MSDYHSEVVDSIAWDPDEEAYRATFDSTTVAPSKAVIAIIDAIQNKEPSQLVPLYDVVNADALDKLCMEQFPGRYDSDRMVQFTYHGYEIRVWSHGTLLAQPGDGRDVSERE